MTLTSPLLKERQILPGDEVITVAAGFPTTVAPIIQYGAVPVFVDVAIPQYNIDPQLLEAAYSPKTKAVMLEIRLTLRQSEISVKNIISGWWKITAMHWVLSIPSMVRKN